MFKTTLLIIVFLVDNTQTTFVRQFNTMEECRTVANEMKNEMTKMKEVENAVFLCSNRIAPSGVESDAIETSL